jgi:hypothetical protein
MLCIQVDGEIMHWIFAHLAGDYLLQTDWMALNKKQSSLVCAVHVCSYMMPFFFCGFKWWQLAFIAAQHFAQDRTNFVVWLMKMKGSEQFATGPCSPWSIIVTDNIIHILFIAVVASL